MEYEYMKWDVSEWLRVIISRYVLGSENKAIDAALLLSIGAFGANKTEIELLQEAQHLFRVGTGELSERTKAANTTIERIVGMVSHFQSL